MRRAAIVLGAMLVAASAAAGELEIRVEGMESAEGGLRVALFADAASFEAEEKLAGVFLPANPEGLAIVLRGLAPGSYGISAFHDRNGNGQLDRNLVGAPKEPYGFSNGARGSFGPPGFDEMTFTVGEEPVAVEIRLR